MNRVRRLGVRLAVIAAAGGVLTLWPFGCASKLPEALSGSGGSQDAPAALVRDDSLPRAFLPHPAFAYAKTGDQAVTIADIAERAAPSVVNVASSKTMKVRPGIAPFLDDPFFRHFFGPGRGEPREQERLQRGMGSGVIVSKDGIVLTNNHVVAGAEEIQVTTADDREFKAKVVGTDEKSDLAVLRLEGDTSDLVPIEFGDSSRLRLGDIVLAIGNPFGVGQTITMGIVSAKGRANMGIVDYEDFIQTDAAINPGNSGGALVDMEGRLVGVNTAILSRTGGYMGIGFAIPSNMAQPIMQSLVADGKVVRGWLGVGIQEVDPELAKALGASTTQGVLVSEVMPDGPGARAGLRRGDVIVSVDGKATPSTGRLRNVIASSRAGSAVTLSLMRDGKAQELKVTLGELPAEEGAKEPRGPEGPTAAPSVEGLSLENLSPQSRRRFEVPASVTSGVIIAGVSPGSAAAKAGLRPGDVILEVDRSKVDSVTAFQNAQKRSKDRLLLLVSRQGRTLYVVLKR
jgi:serine protease Do